MPTGRITSWDRQKGFQADFRLFRGQILGFVSFVCFVGHPVFGSEAAVRDQPSAQERARPSSQSPDARYPMLDSEARGTLGSER